VIFEVRVERHFFVIFRNLEFLEMAVFNPKTGVSKLFDPKTGFFDSETGNYFQTFF
jgi:hypothetical protein